MRSTPKDAEEHQTAFDRFYLWHPIVQDIWLRGPLPSIMQRESELDLDGSRGYFESVFARHVYRGLQLKPGLKVLIAGCGCGRDEQEIMRREPRLELVSCDISDTMIRTARRNHTPSTLVQCLLERLPFPDESFHRVLSREVIEHVMDPRAALAEIYRVLVPGGTAVVTTPNGSSLVRWSVRLTGLFANRAVRDDAIALGRLKRWIRQAGFVIGETIFDGACYLTMVAWPRWLRWLTAPAARLAHTWSHLPIIRRVVCDQVKFVLVRPGETPAPACTPSEPLPYVEDERDRALRQAVEKAKCPVAAWYSRWLRAAVAAFCLPIVCSALVVLLLPVSLLVLVGRALLEAFRRR